MSNWVIVFGRDESTTIHNQTLTTSVEYTTQPYRDELLGEVMTEITTKGYKVIDVRRAGLKKSGPVYRGSGRHQNYCDSIRSAGGTCDCGADKA